MKTSNVLATLLFGSIAAAAPLDRRALVYKTEVVTETVVVYTTVWDDETPKTEVEATSSAGLFYEQPSKPAAKPTHVYTPPVVEPSSVYTPAPSPQPETPKPKPAPTSTYTPAPAPEAPKPTSVYTPPVVSEAPEPSSVAPAPEAPKPSAPASNGNSQKYHGDITIYDNTGAAGACGKPLTDDMMVVALAKPTWGESTYDVMTGESTNPWCGKEITVEYNGNQIQATIQDLCPECAAGDIDLSLAAWTALTKTSEKTRFQADWWTS